MSINDSSVNLKLSDVNKSWVHCGQLLPGKTRSYRCQQHALTLDLEDERGIDGSFTCRESARHLQSIIIYLIDKVSVQKERTKNIHVSTPLSQLWTGECTQTGSANTKPSPFSSSGCEFRSICQICLSFHIKTGLCLALWCLCCPGEGEMSQPNGQFLTLPLHPSHQSTWASEFHQFYVTIDTTI